MPFHAGLRMGGHNKLQEGQLPQTESAHLVWLYRTVRTVALQKAFQSETV